VESPGLNSKNFYFYWWSIITACVLVSGLSCAGTQGQPKRELPPLTDAPDNSSYTEKWEKYGAYYDYDEEVFTSMYTMESCVSIIDISKKIVILSTEGAQYGTIPQYRYSMRMSVFEPHLFDSSGVEIPVDKDKLRETYSETGKIVFPSVAKGSVITLKIRFVQEHSYYRAFSHC
jgi:hypothetical protein